MPRKKTFTLHGPAAGEYIRAQAGAVAKTNDECALRVATFVHLYMGGSDPSVAVALVKAVAEKGLEAAAKICTAQSVQKAG